MRHFSSVFRWITKYRGKFSISITKINDYISRRSIRFLSIFRSSVEMLCYNKKLVERRVQSGILMECFPILHSSLLLKLQITDRICD